MRDRTLETPRISYVLAAVDGPELVKALAWLRTHRLSPAVEVVLAAPATELARTAARVIPSGVRLAGAIRPANRNAVRVAGAAVTTGGVVMVVDCDDDIDAKVRDPLTTDRPTAAIESPVWTDAGGEPSGRFALPPGLGTRTPVPEPT